MLLKFQLNREKEEYGAQVAAVRDGIEQTRNWKKKEEYGAQVAVVRDGIEQTRTWRNERPRSRNSDVDQLSSEFLPLLSISGTATEHRSRDPGLSPG